MVRVIGRYDVYPVKTFKVILLLQYLDRFHPFIGHEDP